MPPTPSPTRRPTSPRPIKLIVAALVFCGIIGGYVAIAAMRHAANEAHRTLPDVDDRQGPCTLWFVGSSTIFKWTTLDRDMVPWDAHDRGVNGAMIPDLLRWFANEPLGPAPAGIVWYAGENDIAAGATGQEAFAAFTRFMAAKTRRYGALPVVALSLKPSPARWGNLREQSAFNSALRQYTVARSDLRFVDIRPLMIEGGRPGPYYVEDGIHMNATGYARWTAMLRPALARLLPPATTRRCL